MAAAAILNLLLLPLLVISFIFCSNWLDSCKIALIYLKRQVSYLVLVFMQKSKMATAAILDFVFIQHYGISVRTTIK